MELPSILTKDIPKESWEEKQFAPFFHTINPRVGIVYNPSSSWGPWDDFKMACWELPGKDLHQLARQIPNPKIDRICDNFERRKYFSVRARWFIASQLTAHFRGAMI